ncbi:hypothetical protein Goshw_019019 [Gossypium schwendimanii]|uniref:DUF7745 domain-containing protein n=1 Tax=Gossypium schwendimanii TaxID=34291 RepID=A0A7J9L4D2_GOSSC|nr:hypothetical protein [Gossypium schwendimanii]
MENGFIDKVEDNAAVRIWSEKTRLEKGDSLTEVYVSELWDFTRISVIQNNHQELKEIWNSAYSYFTFGKMDLVPTVEEYTTLLRSLKIRPNKFARFDLSTPDMKKRVNVFALSIYELIIFPKALGHVDEAVLDLFDIFDKKVTPVPVILAETFRSLNACWRAGEGRFIRCAQLLLAWFHSHFWRMIPDEILYRCRDFDWVSLLGIWGAVGYVPLLVLRQYRLRQFIPATQRLAQCEFWYKGDNYKKKWWGQRVNDNIPVPNEETTRSLEEHLQVIPSKLEIIKQDFEKRNLELGKKIKQLEEEKMQLGVDVDVQKLEANKLRKGKNKAEEDLDSLKIDYKKLRLSMRTVRENTIEKDLLECQNVNVRLKAKLKRKTEALKTALQNCELQVKLLETNNEHWKEGQELAWLLQKVKALSIRAKPQPIEHRYSTRAKTKVMDQRLEREMKDQILESQRSMISQLAQLLVGEREKGKSTAVHLEAYPRRVHVTIRPQQYQIGTSAPMNYQTGSCSNSGDNPTNPFVPDLDDMAEMDKTRVELLKQLEDRCRWLEEKFKVMENADYHCEIDAKDLSLVPDLVLPPKFKTLEFEKYNWTSYPEAHIMMFC